MLCFFRFVKNSWPTVNLLIAIGCMMLILNAILYGIPLSNDNTGYVLCNVHDPFHRSPPSYSYHTCT